MNKDLIVQVFKHKCFKPTTCSIVGSIFLWEYISTKYDKKIKPSFIINNCTKYFYDGLKSDGTLVKSITNLSISLIGITIPIAKLLEKFFISTIDLIVLPMNILLYLMIYRPELILSVVYGIVFIEIINSDKK